MTPLLDRLRDRGWRLTPQRRAVAQALDGEHIHLTAEQIHSAAQRFVPEVSVATVYNTLAELVDMGEVNEIRFTGRGSIRYDPAADVRHHHLVCEGCGLILDVQPDGVDALSLPRSERHGFTVRDAEVVFRGVCSACAEASG